MLELKERTHTLQEIRDFKKEVLDNGNRDATYLLENITILRILGWQLKLGTRFKHEDMVKFWQVLKFDSQLPKRSIRLHIPKESK